MRTKVVRPLIESLGDIVHTMGLMMENLPNDNEDMMKKQFEIFSTMSSAIYRIEEVLEPRLNNMSEENSCAFFTITFRHLDMRKKWKAMGYGN